MSARNVESTPSPTRQEMALLLELTRHLGAGEAIEDVLEVVAREFRQILPFDRMEYSIIEDDDRTLVVRWVDAGSAPVVLGPGDVCVHPEPIPLPEYRRPYLYFDLPAYGSARPDDDAVRRLAAAGYHASISCPLVVDGRVAAIVFFNTVEPGSWDEHHLALVELIAGHLSLAAARAKLTEELRSSNAELRRIQAARTEFVASVSHEIRTPLTAIVGLAETLHTSIDTLSDDEVREFTGLVSRQAKEVSDLVEDLLVATREEAASLTVAKAVVDVPAVVVETLELLDIPVPVGVNGTVRAVGDPLRLRQIVRNLVTNAVRHGGPDVRIDVASGDGAAVIEVSDDGAGVPPALVPAMFDPFARSADGHAESVGLGLAVSRSLARAMGGDLSYDRRDDRTVMSIRLPAP